jgi:hypothetical protein
VHNKVYESNETKMTLQLETDGVGFSEKAGTAASIMILVLTLL